MCADGEDGGGKQEGIIKLDCYGLLVEEQMGIKMKMRIDFYFRIFGCGERREELVIEGDYLWGRNQRKVLNLFVWVV